MRSILKFIALPWRRKIVLLEVLLSLVVVRFGLQVVSFETLRNTLSRLANKRTESTPARRRAANRILWAMSATRGLPLIGTCLTQALAGHVLLSRQGYQTNLCIGVAKDAQGKFIAHAWLQDGDRIVLGLIGADLQNYTPMPALRGLEP